MAKVVDRMDCWIITMGCNVDCPFVPSKHVEDWGLADPSGGPIEDYRKTRDIIHEKVKDLRITSCDK